MKQRSIVKNKLTDRIFEDFKNAEEHSKAFLKFWYDEIKNVKLLNEKKFLTTEIQKIQKELEQKDKIIKELSSDSNDNVNAEIQEKGKESYLIGNLKRQYKELQTYTKIKEEELERLKKNIKATKLTEMSEELKVYQSELNKLKSFSVILEEKKIVLDKKVHNDQDIIKGLQYKLLLEEDKVIRLSKEVNEKDEKIYNIEQKLKSNVNYSIIEQANESEKYTRREAIVSIGDVPLWK